ncbi:hypothetical protein D8674_028940 [Pyrus ussuriensis x Pyrus communis]|uniref:Uncharacterized protein n=1 Tax=Pyrus ussuriensis x Pyrus communis TaxID=2448454 RepID=A0A5N5I0S1_9ROSA|nr:hypothetical protein D8674_028940 [Pyrus ussuriensis x Pyrus communis]
MHKLEDAIHWIIVRQSVPDWPPLCPPSSAYFMEGAGFVFVGEERERRENLREERSENETE